MAGRIRVDNRDPLYGPEQVDQLILTPEARSTVIIKKKPRYEQVPIYELDEKGEKVKMLDEDGKILVDADGKIRYLIKDYDYVQRGWVSSMETLPASELFTIDLSTSNISADAVRLITNLMWNYNHILSLHGATDEDFSTVLHKIRNDIIATVTAAKSYHGGTLSAVKTYRTMSDNRQWQYLPDEMLQAQQKPNPFSAILGGFGKKQPAKKENDDTKYTAFQ